MRLLLFTGYSVCVLCSVHFFKPNWPDRRVKYFNFSSFKLGQERATLSCAILRSCRRDHVKIGSILLNLSCRGHTDELVSLFSTLFLSCWTSSREAMNSWMPIFSFFAMIRQGNECRCFLLHSMIDANRCHLVSGAQIRFILLLN